MSNGGVTVNTRALARMPATKVHTALFVGAHMEYLLALSSTRRCAAGRSLRQGGDAVWRGLHGCFRARGARTFGWQACGDPLVRLRGCREVPIGDC